MKYVTFKERLRDHLADALGETICVDDLVDYLYAKGVIDGVQVRKFLVKETFEAIYTGEPVSANSAVERVAVEFDMDDTYVWKLVKD